MKFRMLSSGFLAFGALILYAPVPRATAATIIFQRDLPNDVSGGVHYVNNAAGPNQANVEWESGLPDGPDYDLVGDTFSFADSATMSTLTFYEVANNGIGSPVNSLPTNEFNSISLYLGPQNGSLSLVSSTYTYKQVHYASPPTNYQDYNGNYFPIYAITFTLSESFAANTLYGFAVDAVDNTSNPQYIASPSTYGLYVAASNAALSTASGGIEDGTDGGFNFYQEASQGQSSVTPLTPTCFATVVGNPCYGVWNKGSDLNVVITGTETPEPATFGFVALALGGLVALRRKR